MYEIRVVENNGEVRAKVFARTQTGATAKARVLVRAYNCPVKVWKNGVMVFTVHPPVTLAPTNQKRHK